MFDLKEHSHTRLNTLTGEWILVSPHRMKRPWQGKANSPQDDRPPYDEKYYLCPDNTRTKRSVKTTYIKPNSFVNDFSTLLKNTPAGPFDEEGNSSAKSENGICKVISFSPRLIHEFFRIRIKQ